MKVRERNIVTAFGINFTASGVVGTGEDTEHDDTEEDD